MNKSSVNGYFSAKIKEGDFETIAPVTFVADFTYEITDRFTFERFANGIVPIEEMKKQLISALNTILTREYTAPSPIAKVEDISKDIYIPLMNHAVTKWDIIWGIKLTSAKLTLIEVDKKTKASIQATTDKSSERRGLFRRRKSD